MTPEQVNPMPNPTDRSGMRTAKEWWDEIELRTLPVLLTKQERVGVECVKEIQREAFNAGVEKSAEYLKAHEVYWLAMCVRDLKLKEGK